MSIQQQLRPKIIAAGHARHRLAVRMVEADLDRRVPRAKTGALSRSKRIVTHVRPSSITSIIAYEAPQAAWTDRGTRPHVIVPRRAGGVLRFPRFGPARRPVTGAPARGRRRFSGGGYVFARKVRHPGNRGNRWFRGAVTLTKWRGYLRAAGRTLG